MNYREGERATEKFRKEYLDGLYALIERREKEGEAAREKNDLFGEAEKHREALKKMLGWPLCGGEYGEMPAPTEELLSEEEGYRVYRMSFEFLEGVRLSGLYVKHNGEEKRPFCVVQHGGAGTPELICGVRGDTSNYNDMAKRVFDEGINVFAPQLLLWNKEKYGVEYDRNAVDAMLKRVGSSVAAVEIYAIRRIFDYFEAKPYTKSLGMVGLSFGGFYTLFTHAVDTRIKAAISCSFFNERKKYPWASWVWENSAYLYSDAEICCLTYPRKMWIEIGDKDELFSAEAGKREFERFEELARGKDKWVSLNVFDGNHEFYCKDEDIKALAKELRK